MVQLTKTVMEEYKYDSKEEREQHIKYMKSQGYECDGQIERSDDSLFKKNREYYWYGRFFKKFYVGERDFKVKERD